MVITIFPSWKSNIKYNEWSGFINHFCVNFVCIWSVKEFLLPNYILTNLRKTNNLFRKGSKDHFPTILQKDEFEEFFLEGSLLGKGLSNFRGFLEIATINFTSQLLLDILYAHWKMLYHLLLFTYGFSLFHFIKSFLMVFYFINYLKRKVYGS